MRPRAGYSHSIFTICSPLDFFDQLTEGPDGVSKLRKGPAYLFNRMTIAPPDGREISEPGSMTDPLGHAIRRVLGVAVEVDDHGKDLNDPVAQIKLVKIYLDFGAGFL